jgi:BMFP domain-containing protein YqiC
MTAVDEVTREQFRRVIDVVLETRTAVDAVDQKVDTLREEVRATNDRILTAMDSMSKELRESRRDHDA